MKIFRLSEQKDDILGMDTERFWYSFSSFEIDAAELRSQDRDIFRTKTDIENYSVFRPLLGNQENYEKTERMV